ncbi:hypothetical protein KFZ70_12620 [Tamlana fucoidanivorans]|nr:hypothetical protein [Tamlana fucoidanivorans]
MSGLTGGGQKGEVEAKYKNVLENSSITTVVVVGNAKVGAETVSAKNF